jgi:hypothetical protein
MPLQDNRRHAEVVKLSRILHASCQCCTLDELDAVIHALRPLVEQGWQIDLTYSCVHEPTLRHVTLGARVDVFDQPQEEKPDTSTLLGRDVSTRRDVARKR